MKNTTRECEVYTGIGGTSSPTGGFVETTVEDVHSIEITRDAKGEYKWTVKMYAKDIQQLKERVESFKEIDADLRGKYLKVGG